MAALEHSANWQEQCHSVEADGILRKYKIYGGANSLNKISSDQKGGAASQQMLQG